MVTECNECYKGEMSIRNAQREAAIEKLVEHLLEHGLAAISLRQLADAAGVSDRMLLYYFADKAEVLSVTLTRIAEMMADALVEALPEGESFSPADLLQRAAALTTQDEMRRFMRFWVEVVAAAARGEPAFAGIAAQIMQEWQTWVESRLILPPDTDRRAVALAIIATIDGLALIDICAGGPAAIQARKALPILST
ncbi:AcrR Transcriptional regulator [Sphingomonadaceae bacterium]